MEAKVIILFLIDINMFSFSSFHKVVYKGILLLPLDIGIVTDEAFCLEKGVKFEKCVSVLQNMVLKS